MRYPLIAAIALLGSTVWSQAPTAPQKKELFEVPAIQQEPTCPKEGWCGEASVQMICMYYGCYFPQKMINASGHPDHPDLWSNDFGKVWTELGFAWDDFSTGDNGAYIAKLKSYLSQGVPVLMGVNVYSNGGGGPHFCIANKCDDQHLWINTTWSMQPVQFDWAKLKTKAGGITLADAFQALAVPAPPILAAHRLRLYPVDGKSFFEAKGQVRIEAAHLVKGGKYQIRTYSSLKSADVNRGGGDIVDEFVATDPSYSKTVEIATDKPLVFILSRVRG